MTAESRKDIKFYMTLIMGFSIMMIGIFTPPVGIVSTSLLWGTAMFLVLAGGIIGMDIPALLHEVNEMKKLKTEQTEKQSQDS